MLKEFYLTEDELAVELGKGKRTLRGWRNQGKGPAWTRIGVTVIYPREGVLEWLKNGQVEPVRSRKAA